MLNIKKFQYKKMIVHKHLDFMIAIYDTDYSYNSDA